MAVTLSSSSAGYINYYTGGTASSGTSFGVLPYNVSGATYVSNSYYTISSPYEDMLFKRFYLDCVKEFQDL